MMHIYFSSTVSSEVCSNKSQAFHNNFPEKIHPATLPSILQDTRKISRELYIPQLTMKQEKNEGEKVCRL